MSNTFGTLSGSLLKEAQRLHEICERQRSEDICRSLLRHAELGDLIKAGCHLILACGQENSVWHAEQALDLYTNLYTIRPGGSFSGRYQPSLAAEARQARFVAAAARILNIVRAEQAAIDQDFNRQMEAFETYYHRRPTDQELVTAALESQLPDMYAYFTEVDTAPEMLDMSAGTTLALTESNSRSDQSDPNCRDTIDVVRQQPGATSTSNPTLSDDPAMSSPQPKVAFEPFAPGARAQARRAAEHAQASYDNILNAARAIRDIQQRVTEGTHQLSAHDSLTIHISAIATAVATADKAEETATGANEDAQSAAALGIRFGGTIDAEDAEANARILAETYTMMTAALQIANNALAAITQFLE